MPPDRLWTCPLCEHSELQPRAVSGVAHRCPHRGGRPVELVPALADPEDT